MTLSMIKWNLYLLSSLVLMTLLVPFKQVLIEPDHCIRFVSQRHGSFMLSRNVLSKSHDQIWIATSINQSPKKPPPQLLSTAQIYWILLNVNHFSEVVWSHNKTLIFILTLRRLGEEGSLIYPSISPCFFVTFNIIMIYIY